jgi:hypothetical protein
MLKVKSNSSKQTFKKNRIYRIPSVNVSVMNIVEKYGRKHRILAVSAFVGERKEIMAAAFSTQTQSI